MFRKIFSTFVIMISVLLPIYNYACKSLFYELHSQLAASGVDFEVIAIEDGSQHHVYENRDAAALLNITHIALPHNIGRSAIRNKLAAMARYEWLLFMDCDSRLVRADYIRTYIESAAKYKESVICGGRLFGNKEEVAPEYMLHWYCGTLREPKADENNIGKAFLSNNFLIRRELFGKVCFEEGLKGYGHEDTLFGIALQKASYDIRYIDNPVFHEGLDSNEAFLIKSRMAVINLRTLKERFLHPDDYEQIRLLQYYEKFRSCYLHYLLAAIYDLFHRQIEKQLKSKKPNLYLFDLYKLGFLCKVMMADQPQLHRSDR